MSDEQSEGHGVSADDPRFQVKWRKKESPAYATPVAGEATSVVGSDSDAASELQRMLDEEKARTNDLRDKWQRAAAEVANLRKRHEQEKQEMEKMAAMALVYDLLPVVDNFERAISSVPGNLQRLTWIHGVMLIERQLRAILESRGVVPIEAQGKEFDPRFHEAVADRETDEAQPNIVVTEYQRGYTMHGFVMRPSMVEVARAMQGNNANHSGIAPADEGQTGESET